MRHVIIFLGYNQSRIQHPVYRRFIQASLVGRNTTLLFQSHQLEEREFVHEVNEQQRRAGMHSELGFHICATLDEPMMGQQIVQAITMIRRLYDVPSYVYALLPDLDTCTAIQKKNAWNNLVAINNGINDYPDVQLLSHCFLYHDSSQVSLANFLFDITQESEALDLVERYGYLNKLRRPKTYETTFEMEFPAIFSSFNVSGINYPDDEIRYFIHQSYLNALLGMSRPNVNPIGMEQCNEHVGELLAGLPLSEELTDLTGDHFLELNRASGVRWQNVEEYWQQAVERILQDLQDKPRDEWASTLRNGLDVDYQTHYRNLGVEYFYRQEKKNTPDYCLALLFTMKERLQQILLHSAYPPETGQDIVRSIINHLQLLALHFSKQQTDLGKALEHADETIKDYIHRWEKFGFFDRMRGKDKALFDDFQSAITQYYIQRTRYEGATFATKLLNEFIPQVSAISSQAEHLTQVCQEAYEATQQYLNDNPPSTLNTTFPVQPIIDAIQAIRLDTNQLKQDYLVISKMLYSEMPPLHAEDMLHRLRNELGNDIDSYIHQRINDGTLPPILDMSIVDRIAGLCSEEKGGLKGFVSQLKNDAAISLKLKGNGGHKEQYLLIAPECGGQLGPQIVGSEPSSLEMLHIITGICLTDLDGFAGQRMFVEPSIF